MAACTIHRYYIHIIIAHTCTLPDVGVSVALDER